ncbi:MAG: glycerol-3-phosphate dehydrogenase [Christensenellales bacterium]
MKTIVIIGAGMMGSAMSIPACDRGHTVRIVGTHLDREIIQAARERPYHITMKRSLPEKASFYQLEQLDEALQGADIVICGVSSFGVDWFASVAVPHIPDGVPVLSVTKGLHEHEDGTLETFPDYLKRITGRQLSFNAIGGPCTSYELADRRHSAVAFCGSDMETLAMLKRTLETDYYHISLTRDIVGLESAVALKNAYALAVSMAIGMVEKSDGEGCQEAYNPQAALFAQSLREMIALLKLLGGGADNIVHGAGDLYVTIFGGRTRRLGTLLGRGLTIREALEVLEGVTLESVVIAKRMVSSLKKKGDIDRFPLLQYIGKLLNGEPDTGMPWKSFCTIG